MAGWIGFRARHTDPEGGYDLVDLLMPQTAPTTRRGPVEDVLGASAFQSGIDD